MNFDYGQGADGSGYKFLTNIQPVVPFSLSQDWNVISRTILPLVYQSHVAGDGRQGGPRRHPAEPLLLAQGADEGRHHLGRRAGDPVPVRDRQRARRREVGRGADVRRFDAEVGMDGRHARESALVVRR